MTIAISTFIIFVVISIFIAKKNKVSASLKANQTNLSSVKSAEPFITIEEAAAFVEKLEKAGYYKYAAAENINALKKDLTDRIAKYGILSTVEDDKTLLPLDYRYYHLDGETLFEYEGFTDILKDMKPTFDKIGLKMEITNHVEEVNNNLLDHRVTINGKEYIIFDRFDGYGWGEAAQRFAEIFNDQLDLQNKDERIYLINGGNDGAAIFLTTEQFAMIDDLLKDENWKPLKVERWCKVFLVDPESYLGYETN